MRSGPVVSDLQVLLIWVQCHIHKHGVVTLGSELETCEGNKPLPGEIIDDFCFQNWNEVQIGRCDLILIIDK
jgi:hypothetical protein